MPIIIPGVHELFNTSVEQTDARRIGTHGVCQAQFQPGVHAQIGSVSLGRAVASPLLLAPRPSFRFLFRRIRLFVHGQGEGLSAAVEGGRLDAAGYLNGGNGNTPCSRKHWRRSGSWFDECFKGQRRRRCVRDAHFSWRNWRAPIIMSPATPPRKLESPAHERPLQNS